MKLVNNSVHFFYTAFSFELYYNNPGKYIGLNNAVDTSLTYFQTSKNDPSKNKNVSLYCFLHSKHFLAASVVKRLFSKTGRVQLTPSAAIAKRVCAGAA